VSPIEHPSQRICHHFSGSAMRPMFHRASITAVQPSSSRVAHNVESHRRHQSGKQLVITDTGRTLQLAQVAVISPTTLPDRKSIFFDRSSAAISSSMNSRFTPQVGSAAARLSLFSSFVAAAGDPTASCIFSSLLHVID
jgi:hypothetical protein